MKLQKHFGVIGIFLWIQRITAQTTAPVPYHLINQSLTWNEAQSFCRVKHSDLVTVNNMDDENKLIGTLGSHEPYAWIGLHKGGTGRWMWSDGSGTVDINKWNANAPNNARGDEWCAQISDTGLWNDASCGEAKGYVCYERREDGAERYVYYLQGQSWVNGQDLCRERHTDMVYVQTELDNSDIADLIDTDPEEENIAWIGLFNDAWMWSDGRETSFRYWLRGFDNKGDCVAAAGAQKGHWVSVDCEEKTTFVCQGDPKVKKILIRMNIHTDVDVTDPTVSDGLLTELRTNLHHLGVTDFSVHWQSVVQHHKQLEVTASVAAGDSGCDQVVDSTRGR